MNCDAKVLTNAHYVIQILEYVQTFPHVFQIKFGGNRCRLLHNVWAGVGLLSGHMMVFVIY